METFLWHRVDRGRRGLWNPARDMEQPAENPICEIEFSAGRGTNSANC
jgi:hypothetical protein